MIYAGLASPEATCQACTRCGLCETRHNVVFGVGPRNADDVCGRRPRPAGRSTGRTLLGPAGRLLDDMLCIIDLGRHNCYIANIVKCRPPKNRDPMEIEQDACIDYLRNQVALIRPKSSSAFSRIAALRLIARFSHHPGAWPVGRKTGRLMTAIYHPSALLRDTSKRPETFRDLKSIQRKIQELQANIACIRLSSMGFHHGGQFCRNGVLSGCLTV
ncbi:MAG: uracil-DNA glycosylase [Oscillospiraceae bacterium]